MCNGIPEDSYCNCCYNCSHGVIKNSYIECGIDGRLVKKGKMFIFRCKDYDEINLVQCEECRYFFRSLGYHVRTHNLTADEYKEKYGYNRTTSLDCNYTTSLNVEAGKKNTDTLLKNHSSKLGIKIQKRGHKFRQEALNNMSSRERSEEHCKKISEAKKGKSVNHGPLSEEHKKNISNACKERFKNINRNIVRDKSGKIVTYTDEYKYWTQYNRIHKNYMSGIKMTPEQMRERKISDVKEDGCSK